MPPVLIGAAILNWGLGALVSAGIMTLGGALLTAVTIGLSYFQQARAKRRARDAYNKSLQDRMVMTATVDQARTRCYGRVRNVDGIVFKGTWGDKKQFYTLVIALAGHEIDGVEKVMFGDVELTLDGSGRVLTAPWGVNVVTPYSDTVGAGSNSVTLPRTPDAGSVVGVAEGADGDAAATPSVSGNTVTFSGGLSGLVKRVAYQTTKQDSRAVVTVYNGGDGQDLSTALATRFPGQIVPGAHKFAGMACLMVELAYNQDSFPNGVPNPITAVFRGAKILDPRTGVTAWSENPALIARDWSLYANGGGCQASDLVGEDFIAAANACDVSHDFTSVNGNGATNTTTRPMFTCDIVCDTSANPMETLAAICESMAGDFSWPGGLLSVRAGAYTAPSWTIDGDWLSDKSQIQMVKDAPRSELLNVLIPTIANSANRYIAAPLPRVAADAYIAIDGEEYPQEVQFEGITDSDHAGHVASVMLKDARAAKTYTLPCNLRGLQVKVGQNVTVNIPEIGLSNELMRCVGWKLDFEQSCCYLTLKSTSAAIFDPDATFKRDDALANSSLPSPFIVPAVDGLTMQSGTAHLFVQSDGTIVSRVLVSWTQAADEAVQNGGAVEIRYGTLDKSPDTWQVATVPGADGQLYLTGLEDQRIYGFMARFRNKLVTGQWSQVRIHQVIGKSAAPVAPVGLSAVQTLGVLKVSRTPSTEADWSYSIFEYSTDGGTVYHTIPGSSDKFGIVWPGPVVGALKIRARDVDSSENQGAWSSPLDVTVTPSDVGASSTLAIKINTADFAGPTNYNEAYIHGFDAAGAPADIAGSIRVNGVAVTVPKGPMYGGQGPVSCVIVWDNGGAGFSTTIPAVRPYAIARKYNGAWQYDSNSAWTAFTPAATHYVIGQIEVGGVDTGAPGTPPGIVVATMLSDAQLLSSIPGDSVLLNPGDALNADPYCLDSSKWEGLGDVQRLDDANSPGSKGKSYFVWAGPGLRAVFGKELIPVDPVSRAYNYSGNLLASVGNDRAMYLVIRPFRADGREYVAGDLGGLSWGGTWGGYTHAGVPTSDGTFRIYGAEFGAGTSRPLPADVAYIRIGVLLQEGGVGSSSTTQAAQYLRLTDITAARAASAAAAAAQSTANTAATNATNALSTLSTMRSNGYLDASEKPALIRQWQAIDGEVLGIVAQANVYGIVSERDAYNTKRTVLANYLLSLSPPWDNTTVDTPIIPATDQTVWQDFYNGRQALLNKIADAAGKVANWTGVVNRPKTFIVRSTGYPATATNAPFSSGIYDGDTNALIYGGGRSYRVMVYNRNGTIDFNQAFDVYGGGAAVSDATSALNTIANTAPWRNKVLVVIADDEPSANHLNPGLLAAMLANGASRAIYGSRIKVHGAYILVAVTGCGEGNGVENYGGEVNDDPDAWCETSFSLSAAGSFSVTGDRAGARSVYDLGYLGSLDATTNKVYEQSGDPSVSPGGVVDGAIWIIPGGKSYQRFGGAWRPYVQPGSVGTGEIEPGAATRLVRSYLVGPVQTFNDV